VTGGHEDFNCTAAKAWQLAYLVTVCSGITYLRWREAKYTQVSGGKTWLKENACKTYRKWRSILKVILKNEMTECGLDFSDSEYGLAASSSQQDYVKFGVFLNYLGNCYGVMNRKRCRLRYSAARNEFLCLLRVTSLSFTGLGWSQQFESLRMYGLGGCLLMVFWNRVSKFQKRPCSKKLSVRIDLMLQRGCYVTRGMSRALCTNYCVYKWYYLRWQFTAVKQDIRLAFSFFHSLLWRTLLYAWRLKPTNSIQQRPSW
jgi:hypothetical protein